MVTDLTYMVYVPGKVESPPAHSTVPDAAVEEPPTQLPILTRIGVCG